MHGLTVVFQAPTRDGFPRPRDTQGRILADSAAVVNLASGEKAQRGKAPGQSAERFAQQDGVPGLETGHHEPLVLASGLPTGHLIHLVIVSGLPTGQLFHLVIVSGLTTGHRRGRPKTQKTWCSQYGFCLFLSLPPDRQIRLCGAERGTGVPLRARRENARAGLPDLAIMLPPDCQIRRFGSIVPDCSPRPTPEQLQAHGPLYRELRQRAGRRDAFQPQVLPGSAQG